MSEIFWKKKENENWPSDTTRSKLLLVFSALLRVSLSSEAKILVGYYLRHLDKSGCQNYHVCISLDKDISFTIHMFVYYYHAVNTTALPAVC